VQPPTGQNPPPVPPRTEPESSSRILTVPNLISFVRILLIPVFVWLLSRHGSEAAGLLLLGAVVSTDWVDGQVARRTGQVSELGKLLDPVADRLAIAAALITLVVRGAFPLWAALLILVRDGAILVAGLFLLRKGARIDVRFIGKVATFALMFAVPAIAWGNFGLALAAALRALGWIAFAIGIVEYYVAAAMYVEDFRRALRKGSAPAAGS
jgi:cardiolipin synthase (CMP-forming)